MLSMTKVATRQHAVKRSAAGDVFSAVVVKILRLNNEILAIGDALAEPAGQSSARWQVLAAVEDEARTVADVARALGLARQSVQRIADVLVDEGFATYEDNPAHQRAKLLALATTGRRALATITIAQAEWANRIGASMGRKPLAELDDGLERLLVSIREAARVDG
jgi:DNA-binding MarR family transcriptional regulator